jgi:hypothetical protein
MTRRKRWIALLIFASIVITFFIFRKPLLKATMPVVEDVTLSEFVLINDSAFVKLSLVVRNKAIWNIELTHVSLGIYDNDLELLCYESDTLQTLERNEARTEEVYCKIPFKEVMERIRQHQGEDTVRLRMKGVLVYSTFLGESSTIIDREIPINVPIPPRISVRGIEYAGREDGDYNLVFALTLKNDNPRMMDLEFVKYELHAGTNIDLNGHLDNISIAALDSTELRVPAVLHLGSGFSIISQIILDRDKMPYSFVMTGTIVTFTGIVQQDVPMTVKQNGQLELYNEDKRDRAKITFRKKQR